MNFLESVITMNFSNTQYLVLKRKVPTIAMNNPPVYSLLYVCMGEVESSHEILMRV